MKKALLYLVILLMTFACQHHYQYPPILQEADSLCVAQPDSAVSLLKSISTEMLQAPEYVQKRYQLLTIKANDKAYITHTSDSLILSLVDYYEHDGDPVYLGETYYYAGRTYSDLGDAPRALEYFQKALDAMPGDENLKVKSKVYAQMGYLLRLQKLYNESFSSYRQSYHCDIIQGDTIGMIFNLRDMGFVLRGLEKLDSTLLLLNQAHELSLSINNKRMDNLITSQMASLYIQLGDYEKAKELIQPSLQHPARSNISSIYSIAADIYYQTAQYDSAAYYYKQLLDKGTIYAQRTANERLASISLNEWHDAKQTLDFSERFLQLQDSINRITASESVAQMNSLYNYQIREKENHELVVKNNRSHVLLLLLTIFVLVVVLLCAYFILQHRNRRIRAELFIERLKQVQEKVYRESADMIMHTSLLRKKLRERAKVVDEIHDEEWKDIESFLNTNYPEFLSRLQTVGDLNKSEYRTCLLLKCQLSPSEIAALLNLTSGGVANIRRRLSQRILLQSKNPSDWDQFIHSL